MWQVFDQALARFRELEQQLADAAVIADRQRFSTASKEHGRLARVVQPYLDWQAVTEQIKVAEEMAAAEADPDMREYAEQELAGLKGRQQELHTKLEDLLLVDPGEDFDSVIVEIRAGTGGDEAAILAADLFDMYSHYARSRRWRVEPIEFSEGEAGGYKEVVFSVSGEGVFQELRYESGGHRVQRVPKTETQGRIHTSAATVAVLPEPDEAQVEIKESDIEWERMRAGGAGGQKVNKTESAVRIWYKRGTPDEMEVKCQDERSQHKNYDRAMRVLRSRLYERQQEKLHSQRSEQRRTLIGSGGRGDRIRTYNFPQNRVTDHRINLTIYHLDTVIAGELSELIRALMDFDKKQKLEQAKAV